MVKICSACGAKNFDDAIICIGCGEKLNQKSSKNIDFRSDLTFDKPHKSKMKFVLIAVIIIVILVLASFFILTHVGVFGDKGKLIGTWKGITPGFYNNTFTFYSNDTYSFSFGNGSVVIFGKYELDSSGNILLYPDYGTWKQTLPYSFSNDSQTLTIGPLAYTKQ